MSIIHLSWRLLRGRSWLISLWYRKWLFFGTADSRPIAIAQHFEIQSGFLRFGFMFGPLLEFYEIVPTGRIFVENLHYHFLIWLNGPVLWCCWFIGIKEFGPAIHRHQSERSLARRCVKVRD